MILRDRCSTYDLASLFPGRRSTLDRWSGKIANRIGTFLFLKEVSQNYFVFMLSTSKIEESRRIVLFLMLPSSKIGEVSHNFRIFDVVKFKN